MTQPAVPGPPSPGTPARQPPPPARPAIRGQQDARRRHSRGSLPLGRIAGIELRLHLSFFALVALVVALEAVYGWRAVLSGLGWLVVLFGSVVVHELAHSLLARRRGAEVEAIVLLPIGGVSRLKRMPEAPAAEFWISLVGPLASLGLGVLGIAVALGSGGGIWPPTLTSGALFARFGWLNFLLGGFNLLPAFPMDGGRVLRALLERRHDRVAATRIAGSIGRAFAIVMGVAGVFVNFWLILIAVFIYFGSVAEEGATELQSGLRGLRVADAMVRDPMVVGAGTPLSEVARLMRSGYQQHFPVTGENGYLGMVGPHEMARASMDDVAGHVANGALPTVAPRDDLAQVIEDLATGRHSALAVIEGGRIVGVLLEDRVVSLGRSRAASQTHG